MSSLTVKCYIFKGGFRSTFTVNENTEWEKLAQLVKSDVCKHENLSWYAQYPFWPVCDMWSMYLQLQCCWGREKRITGAFWLHTNSTLSERLYLREVRWRAIRQCIWHPPLTSMHTYKQVHQHIHVQMHHTNTYINIHVQNVFLKEIHMSLNVLGGH